MPFSPSVREDALVRSKRSCCICQEFTGLFNNVHHIMPEADGGPNTLDNAVVLCLRCHGEVGHYNPRHPIGNKYSQSEVRRHRDEWWEWCKKNRNAPPPKQPILVSPNAIKVVSGHQRIRSGFTLHNTTNTFYYDVWVQLVWNLRHVDKDAIEIEEKVSSLDKHPGLQREDSLLTGGAGSDTHGNPAIWTALWRIDPHESFDYSVVVDKAAALKGDSLAEAQLEVLYFQETPADSVSESEEGRVQMKFRPRGHAMNRFRFGFKGNLPKDLNPPRIVNGRLLGYDLTFDRNG